MKTKIFLGLLAVLVLTSGFYFITKKAKQPAPIEVKTETRIDQKVLTLRDGNRVVSQSHIEKSGDGSVRYYNQVKLVDPQGKDIKVLAENSNSEGLTYKIFKITPDERRLYFYLKQDTTVNSISSSSSGTTNTPSGSNSSSVSSNIDSFTFFQHDVLLDTTTEVTPQQAISSGVDDSFVSQKESEEEGGIRIKALER